MAKCFSKKYGNKGRAFNYLQSEYKLCQDAWQCLKLHPYITASKTIVNIYYNPKLTSGIGH